MTRFDAAAVLLEWATGGLAFLWVTTRHRRVGPGYGWLLRVSYLVLLAGAFAVGRATHTDLARDGLTLLAAVATAAALIVSLLRRAEGGAGFDPRLDLIAPAIGAAGLVAAAADIGGNVPLEAARLLVGAAFLGAVSDAMLLGHWYLVQPGLERAPLLELVRALAIVWPIEIVVLLLPTGMISALTGSVDDRYNGLLSWFWVACAVATIILVGVTRAALREREYSAVMAATGLLYLAILTAFGTDLVSRAILAG